MDLKEQIAVVNRRLKIANLGVRIEQIKNYFYLVGVFPPKPNSNSPQTQPYQQRIALGIRANLQGLKQAEKEAIKIAGLVVCKEFSWDNYLKKPISGSTVEDWLDRFNRDYFDRRKKDAKSLTTWRTEYENVFRKLPPGESLTSNLLLRTVLQTQPDTRSRKRFCESLGRLAKFAGVEVDLTPYKGTYSSKAVNPRDLPTDDLIQEWFNKIPNQSWRWSYGILATYGIRPHELFWSELGDDGILSVWEGKTISGKVWPIYPEWVDLFDLKNVSCPKCSGANNGELGHRISTQFRRYNIPFQPYDLRHCWAVRSIAFGLPVALAAKQMRHSVKVHTELYHHWISDRHHQEVYDTLLKRSDRPKPPL